MSDFITKLSELIDPEVIGGYGVRAHPEEAARGTVCQN